MTIEYVVVASGSSEARERWSSRLGERFAICEATERKSLHQVITNLRPCVALLDLALPGLGRVTGLPVIRRLSPATKILAATDNPTHSEGIAAIKAGAKGYYTGTVDASLLKKAVLAVQNGELWVERGLATALVEDLVSVDGASQKAVSGKPDRRLECLTLRQREVADAIATGASN